MIRARTNASSIERLILPAYVVAQFAQDSTRSGRSHPRSADSELTRVIAEHDGVLLPAFEPDRSAGEPSESATIAVPDMGRADQLAAALREIDGIETAYAKPGEELP